MKKLINQENLLLYDGECALCNGFISYILPRLGNQQIYFLSLHDERARPIFKHYNIKNQLSSVVFIKNSSVYIKSDAAIAVFNLLPGMKTKAKIISIFPLFLRNKVYEGIAKFRYSVFGKSNTCTIPDPKLKRLFL